MSPDVSHSSVVLLLVSGLNSDPIEQSTAHRWRCGRFPRSHRTATPTRAGPFCRSVVKLYFRTGHRTAHRHLNEAEAKAEAEGSGVAVGGGLARVPWGGAKLFIQLLVLCGVFTALHTLHSHYHVSVSLSPHSLHMYCTPHPERTERNTRNPS